MRSFVPKNQFAINFIELSFIFETHSRNSGPWAQGNFTEAPYRVAMPCALPNALANSLTNKESRR